MKTLANNNEQQHTIPVVRQRTFANLYEDDKGRYISDADYVSYEEAYKNRDDCSTYLKTVEIIEHVA